MRLDRRASTRIAGALDVVERKTSTRVMKASLLAAALMASAAGLSAAQGPAAWLSCQRNNLCTINDRGLYPAGVTKRIPQKAASACSAAGFSYYLPVSEIELLQAVAGYKGSQMVRLFHEDDPGGNLFACSFNVNRKYRREAEAAGHSWGWPVPRPVATSPTDVTNEQDGLDVPESENDLATYTLWTIEDTVLAATGAPLTYLAVATGLTTELQIGCFVPAKQSYVRAYFPEDLGGTGGVQVWFGIGVLQGEEWNRDEGAVSLEESGGIENLAIARLVESARDTGTLHLTVPAEDGFTRHEAEINLAGSLPALSAVREKCAAAFSASP